MKIFYNIILITMLLLSVTFSQQQPTPDLIFQSEVDAVYKTYLTDRETEFDLTLADPMNNANTMKAYLGKAMIHLAWIPVEADSQIGELEPVIDDLQGYSDSVEAIFRDEIDPIRTEHINEFLIDLRELFIDPRYSTLKDRITEVTEGFQSSFDTTGIILESFFEDVGNHLEVSGDNLGALIDSSSVFTFRFKVIGAGVDDSLFVITRGNLRQIDSLMQSIEKAGKAFDRAVSMMDSLQELGGGNASEAISKLRETVDHIDQSYEQLGDILTRQPFAPLDIDTSFIGEIRDVLTEADTILAGKEFDVDDGGKTIRPVAILENAPAGLQNLLLDYYRIAKAERGSYTFGNLFPQGLPGDLIEILDEDMIINDSDDPEAFAARMRYYSDYYLPLTADKSNPQAHLAVAIAKTYLLLYDHMGEFDEFIAYMEAGDYRDILARYDWDSFSYPATTDSICQHFEIARRDEDMVFVMLIKTKVEPENPYNITSESEFMPNYIFKFELDIVRGLVNTMVDARNGLVDGIEHMYGEVEKMFDMTLDPNQLDFSECESFHDFLLVLQASNPDYLNITEYGVEQFTKAGDDMREMLTNFSETTHHFNRLMLAIADHQEDLGMDGETWTSFSGGLNDFSNEVTTDFMVPDSTTFMGERVNLSAWFDNPPDMLLQRLIWFADSLETTDNTLGGLFPDRGFGETGVRSPIQIPLAFMLGQNYPNPFNPTTTIEYALAKPAQVELKLYNIIGQEMATLVSAYQKEGRYAVDLQASNLATGIYFYRLQAGDYNETRRCVVIK
jgi:hypothetical protein